MPRYTPLDHIVDPDCQAPAGRHAFYSAHRYDKCTCPGESFDKYLASRERENEQRNARRTSRSMYRTNPDCQSRWHGSSDAATNGGCICAGSIATSVQIDETAAVAARADCPSTGRHGSLNACVSDGCRCPGVGYDLWQLERARMNNAERERANERRSRAADSQHMARFPTVPQVDNLDEETRMVLHSDDAACAGMDVNIFYGVGSGPESKADERYAKSVCARCPVQRACAEGAIARGEPWGIWGGLTFSERRDAKQRRQQVAA